MARKIIVTSVFIANLYCSSDASRGHHGLIPDQPVMKKPFTGPNGNQSGYSAQPAQVLSSCPWGRLAVQMGDWCPGVPLTLVFLR
jgi:hypothetical protein